MGQTVEFAVVDVETTGPLPERHDRVIEVAVVRLDAQGHTVGEYCSLVNPNRDVGSTHIHGITARDLQGAPRFDEIAGDIIALLSGAVFVAHNVHFDARFIAAEMKRAGYQTPALCTLCTMSLARRVAPDLPCRRLEAICRHFGVPLTAAHTAGADARAAAGVLCHCLERIDDLNGVIDADGVPPREHWPAVRPSRKCYVRSDSARDASHERSYLGELISRLPAVSDPNPNVDQYLDLLDRVLEDRRITEDEFEALSTHAEAVGLVREQVVLAHHGYLTHLVEVALSDGQLSVAEQRDLDDVRRLLCVSESDFATMLSESRSGDNAATKGRVSPAAEDVRGKSVCFTGELRCTIGGEPIEREQAEEMAASRGMVVKSGVSKALDILVVADPHSMSGKAKKARDYGTRIVAEAAFWQMLQVPVD